MRTNGLPSARKSGLRGPVGGGWWRALMTTPRPRWRKAIRIGTLLVLLLLTLFWALWVLPFWGWPFNAQRHSRVPLTPPWALECWIWEDDANTAEAVRELLDGCVQHDIPVRTVLIDSPWSTRYNDFAVDEKRYPEPGKFFGRLQEEGYRVVLWMTCMVNSRSKDTAVQDTQVFYGQARERGFLAGDGRQVRWWKGRGGFIDYTNPAALQWWHGLQEQVFAWGIDGWKLDGTDTLFSGRGFLPYQRTHRGWLSTREYMDLYNREEYRHGLTRNPEFIVLTRAIDDRYYPLSHPEGFAPLDAAPVTWVGDRTHEWSSKARGAGEGQDAMRDDDSWLDRGFEGALRDILASAAKGYGVVGDDVAGYHGPEPIPPRLYIRWAQFAAFTGLFLNGGHGERRLWKRTPEELEIVRQYSWMHTELVPYMFTHVVRCHEGGPPLLRPVRGKYHYLFGDDLLVAPIYRDDSTHTVELPAGRWRALFRDGEVVEGPASITRAFALDDYPVFVRDGAILPLNVTRAYTGFGDAKSAGFLTWAIWPRGTNTFTVEHTDRSGRTTLRVERSSVPEGKSAPSTSEGAHSTGELRLALSGVKKPHILRILMARKPAEVRLDERLLEEGRDWTHDATAQRLVIRTERYDGGRYLVKEPRAGSQ